MSDTERPALRNRLLSSLSPEDHAALAPHLRPVELRHRATLFRTGDPLAAAWFPLAGYVSLLATFENGDAVEVGMAGTEGMVGLSLLLGVDRSPVEAIVQSEGRALRIDAEPLRRIAEERPGLRAVLLQYTHVFHMLVTMTAACNARHLLEQRLARWLLMAHDRTEGDEFPITHEFLSLMLGVRRAGVTVAAGALQRAGLVRYDQGRMQVTNREGLERAACECHRVVRREYRRLLGNSEST